MTLAAGDLRHRIVIRRPVEVDNNLGGYVTNWTTIATIWAEVKGLDGREAMISHVLQGVSAYRMRIRYRPGLQPSDQVQHAGLDLNIRSISDPDGRREQLVIIADTASARVDGG